MEVVTDMMKRLIEESPPTFDYYVKLKEVKEECFKGGLVARRNKFIDGLKFLIVKSPIAYSKIKPDQIKDWILKLLMPYPLSTIRYSARKNKRVYRPIWKGVNDGVYRG